MVSIGHNELNFAWMFNHILAWPCCEKKLSFQSFQECTADNNYNDIIQPFGSYPIKTHEEFFL